jgi:hypothetical protein
MNTAQAKQIKITDYLSIEGISPTRVQGNDFRYRSPLRQETTASFKVKDSANVWFGKGRDLVMAMYRFDTVSQALGKLSDKTPSPHSDFFSFQQQKTSSGVVIFFTNTALTEYVKSRHIDLKTAQKYCNDIYYSVGGRNYFAVGFKNDCGG